jgi:hypothetical protein
MSPEPSRVIVRDMVEPPQELGEAKVLKYAVVTPEVEPTGATRHTVGGVEIGPASALAIARHPADEGIYLFYLDDYGAVVTDTWHESLDDALNQAAFEYDGHLTWTDVTSV